MDTIKWGIIGCGDVTEVKSGPAFNKVENSKLVAVMRRDAARAEDYAKRHQVGRWYSNADALINDSDVNAIYVATPPLYHEELTIKALKAGKPVYVEKPMAVDAAAAERMLLAANETGVKLSVAHYRRQLPLFKKVHEILQCGVLGDIRFIKLELLQPDKSSMIAQTPDNWRVDPAISGGGLFHDLAPHQLDLMFYFFGKPTLIKGTALNQANYYKASDLVNGLMVFENNVLFHGLWCFTVPAAQAKDTCEITGSKGSMSFSIFNQNGITLTIDNELERFEFNNSQHIQQPMIDKVVQYFLGNGTNPCTADDGVEVMRIIDAMSGH